MNLQRHRWAIGSVIVVALIILLAVFAPVLCSITSNNPYTYHTELLDGAGVPVNGPSTDHWFGVEPQTGRDLFSIVAFGAQTSLVVGLGATVIILALGVGIGIIAGYYGGWVDSVLSKFTDFMLLFPGLIFMIALSTIVPDEFPRIALLILIIGFFGWGGIARVVRSETLKIKQNEYIKFSRLIGSSNIWIILRHILPNITSIVIIYGALMLPGAIASEAAMSFLGIGVPAPTPSWGRSISDAVTWINVDPLYLMFPGLMLFSLTLAFNIFGDWLRDFLDPNLTEVGGIVE
jgi:peptide/nickel transport system permease protein